jgi:hypothetical protein
MSTSLQPCHGKGLKISWLARSPSGDDRWYEFEIVLVEDEWRGPIVVHSKSMIRWGGWDADAPTEPPRYFVKY